MGNSIGIYHLGAKAYVEILVVNVELLSKLQEIEEGGCSGQRGCSNKQPY